MLEVEIRARVRDFVLRVAFKVHNGELLALFGPSGTGKSLTLRCLAGLLRPEAGRIVLNGRTLFEAAARVDLPPQARRVGYVPQHYALFPHLTVTENIGYGLHDQPAAERRVRVAEMVKLMRLEGLETRRPHQLSGGQQQRVALARALITEPEALLLDEPFAALDGAIRGRLQNELLALQRRFRIPTLLVTHDLAEAYALSDRLAVFEGGQVLQIGPKDEVLRRPVTRAVARFVGTKNIFEGQVVTADQKGVTIAWSGHFIQTLAAGPTVGQRVSFCIRPEEVMVVRPDRPLRLELQENMVEGWLVGEIDRGPTQTLFFKADGVSSRDYDLEILLPHHAWLRLGLTLGQAVAVSLKRSAVHVLAG